jgi:hypothetical protein
MTGLMRLSKRVYGGILTLYPPELRGDFGCEMNELFSEDLSDAWRSKGLVGVIGIWWCALCEIFRIALPAQRSNPAFAVPVMAWAFSTLTTGAELVGSIRHNPMPVQAIFVVILFPSIVTALTAIVVVHTGRVNVVALDLKCSKSAI